MKIAVKSDWLANRMFNIYPDGLGMKQLLTDLNTSLKVRLHTDAFQKARLFQQLNHDDLAAVISQSAFPNLPCIWVEWENATDLCWPPNPERPMLQAGCLVHTSAQGQVGRINIITDTADELYVLPLSVFYDWRESYLLDKKQEAYLRESIMEQEVEKNSPNAALDAEFILEVRRRFGFEPSQYLNLTENQQSRRVTQSALKFILDAESLLVGVANVLDCIDLDDWRIGELSIH